MKPKIHPQYKETTIVCACGEIIHTRSTKENIHVEICSKCHPFFTGKQKLIDSAGMVDKYMKRFEKKKKPVVKVKKEEPAGLRETESKTEEEGKEKADA